MQYMILIYEPEDGYAGAAGEATLMEVVARHTALAEDLEARGVLQGGGGLQETSTATTIVTKDGRQTLHDGPFAETREHLGGYYLVDVADLDAALEIARRVPVIDGGKVEVRPLADY